MAENGNSRNEEEANEIIEIRKEKIAKLLKGKEWIYYIILAVITWIAVYIRTRNIPRLKDISTGTWTLGPDLDPFLFLRWAEYIAEHGKLFVIDTMRYTPLGYDTAGEMKLLAYMINWLYQILSVFNKEVTITYAAIIFPVIAFALTCIVFFFLTRKIFYDSFENKNLPNIIALIATLFLAVTPSILPRTIAGIPEKEAAGFLFISLSFYFIISAFKSEDYKKSVIYGALSGVATALLGLVWGGVTFIFLSVGLSVFIYFVAGRVKKTDFAGYCAWIIAFMPILMIFSSRYTITSFFTSTSTIPVFATLAFIVFDMFVYQKIKVKKLNDLKEKYHIPQEIISILLVGLILIILSIIIFKNNFIYQQFNELLNSFIKPLATNRFVVTVAENRQPFFNELAGEFGPQIGSIQIFFWVFIIGSIVLFYNLVNKIAKKDRIIITASYAFAIFAVIFSKYSQNSKFNGVSIESIVLYFGGMVVFAICTLYILYKYNKKNEKSLLEIDFGYIILFTLFFTSLLAARGGVRFIMMLVPPASILASYFLVKFVDNSIKSKEDTNKIILWVIAAALIISIIYSGYMFYNYSKAQAEGFYPGSYQWQWQKAMSWARESTSENAVFGHWWDYGYWVQSIGERATVLDGGNAIVYWNHLMGRHVLTTPNDSTALEFLYTHNATHLLIDSTDIGKYSAFSSIGADEDYDRFSYISTFFMDPRSTKETNNGKIYAYTGGSGLDEDIIWEDNGTKYTFMQENSGIGAIVIEQNISGALLQPKAIFVQQGRQVNVPIRYSYYDGKLHDFGSGIDAGVFIMPTLESTSGGLQKMQYGSLFYLSRRTVHSLLIRKYLFAEEGNFKLVHNEPSIITADLRAQGLNLEDFVYYQGQFLGPIKIWEVQYPSDVKINPDYLKLDYPNEELKRVR
ncbi:hypothetical protein J4466_00015 [Candidatus Pacearchaeota archaeon]|nr:hypothetical protein [Candidatus Pacearchaeota archaeon]